MQLPANAAEDSYSILPALLGQPHPQPLRAPTKEMSYKGVNYLTIRDGDWKLVNGLGSGGFTGPIQENPRPANQLASSTISRPIPPSSATCGCNIPRLLRGSAR